MQASAAPPAWRRRSALERRRRRPAPRHWLGNGDGAPTEAAGAAPFTGGNGEAFAGALWFGNGAGNAPCAKAWPA